MSNKNAYYDKCVHQEWLSPKCPALCNSYSAVKCICKKYNVDVFMIHRTDNLPMCCVSLSPYAKQNCQFFKNKNNQTQLSIFE